MVKVYLNWDGPQGKETVDEFTPEPGQRIGDFWRYIRQMAAEYRLSGMAVYSSRRPCKDWEVSA